MALSVCFVAVFRLPAQAELVDVTQPGDPIVPTSYNSPAPDGVANAIDNTPQRYMNFDKLNAGFTVTPSIGPTVVLGLTLTSANDFPDRDPASYTLEGSNDGTNFVAISSGSVPPFPTRFYKQQFLFLDHTNSYRSYRLLFPTIVNPATALAMQISEVELVGEISTEVKPCTNGSPALIARQPVDTPVLLGQQATFRVRLTGPWKAQWYRDGVEIPGATSATYTTPPVTASDDGARFRLRVEQRLSMGGCYVDSDEVMLSIFTPSTIESIGLNWRGSGFDSGPTEMLPQDITGIHPQAYWNNLRDPTGSVTRLTNSSAQVHPTITVRWATSAEWWVGAGNEDATQRMLNGLCTSQGTNEQTAQSVTFSNVPPGSHSLLIYTVQIPQEFFSVDFQAMTFNTDGSMAELQQRFIRPQNSDEYNPSPAFVLVTSDTPATRAVGNAVRFDNLQPGDGRIQLRFFSPDWHQSAPPADPVRGPGVNGLQLLLNPAGVQTRLQPLSYSGTAATLSFATIRNLKYTIEYTSNLKQPITWTPLLPMINGTGSPATALDPSVDGTMRFYRVRIE